jgi:hypothetical protein
MAGTERRGPIHDEVARFPWDRRSNETKPAYEAFRIYLEMGAGRSLRRVSETLGKQFALITRWSSRHEWVRRTLLHEQWLYHRSDELVSEELSGLQMKVRHNALKDYKSLRDMLLDEMAALQMDMTNDPTKDQSLALKRLIEAFKSLDDMGRRAVNLPNTYQSGTAPASDSDDGMEYIITDGGVVPTKRLEDGAEDDSSAS